MSDEQQDLRYFLKKVTADLRETRRRLARAEARSGEPVAIVGMSCRFPGGVAGPDDLWDLVRKGGDGIGAFPADRGWDLDRLFHDDPGHAGTTYAREGGFLAGAAEFDAEFFGISPREALAMDPQQRLLLECSWEALEHAGVDPATLRGSATAVFAGTNGPGYPVDAAATEQDLEGYLLTGLASSVASGRVSYVFGFEGPAVTVDTACSSSLVAMHLAAQALRSGECTMALAGGVTVIGSPGSFIEFARQRGLSADGRCKSFSSTADGTGWGEGVGIVVLERLSDAQRAGHRILAVVKGSAVNQDGASNGLTAPNGPSQQRVIRRALAVAGLGAADVDAVEAHGTGTTLGDPIEAQALIATYGEDRDPQRPLWLGSVKSNLGHTQAAAGIAGVIKMVQALRHEELPPTLHVAEPTDQVDWSGGTVELLTEGRPWVRNGRPRRAGVSAFGISGTNAHLILEEAPEADKPVSAPLVESVPGGAAAAALVVPVVVSARGRGALGGQAARLREYLGTDSDLAAVARALVTERAVLPDRAVVVAADVAEAVAGLDALPSPAVRFTNPDVVFVFPGQGAQWVGMGRALRDRFPVFAERFDEACALLDSQLTDCVPAGLRAAVFEGSGSVAGAVDGVALVDQTVVAQAGLFAVQAGLVALLESFGVRPAAVVGHSIGEVAAAYAAGVLSLSDAARLVAARGLAMQQAPAGGAMAAVNAPEDEIRPLLTEDVEISGVNAADSVVLSGRREAVEPIVDALRAQGRRVRWLSVSHAFHSADMDSVLPQFADALTGISFTAPAIPMISTLTGLELESVDADYWVDQARGAVRFAEAVSTLIKSGRRTFVEIGPATLSGLIDHDEAVALALTRRDNPEDRDLLTALGTLFVRGVGVDWTPALPAIPSDAAAVELPTYAFQHRRYWIVDGSRGGDATALGLAGVDHPLLGAVVELPRAGGVLFTSRLSLAGQPWLADHAMQDVVLLPGAGLVELAIRAGDLVGTPVLDELVIEAPFVLPAHGGLRVQVAVDDPDERGARAVAVYSAPEADEEGAEGGLPGVESWQCHASGLLLPDSEAAPTLSAPAQWPPAGVEPLEVAGLYPRLNALGYGYGPLFRGLRRAWRDPATGDIYAEAALDEEHHGQARRYGIHPALLDAALHAALADQSAGDGTVGLPFSYSGVTLHASGATTVRAHLVPGGRDGLALRLMDETGAPVLTLRAMASRPVTAGRLTGTAGRAGDDALLSVEWTRRTDPADAEGPDFVSAADAAEISALAARIADGAPPPAWLVLAVPSANINTDAAADTATATATDSALAALDLLNAWSAQPELEEVKLAVLSNHAVAISRGDTTPDPARAALWGLVRTARIEWHRPIALLDAAWDDVPAALAAAADGEDEVAIRAGVAWVPTLVRGTGALAVPQDSGIGGTDGIDGVNGIDSIGGIDGAWRLAGGPSGSLDDLALVAAPDASAPLRSGEVRIAMRALGLNFRDVLIGLGMYPGEAQPGTEGAGIVTEVGPDVTGLAVGDRVLGIVLVGFGSVAVADHRCLVPIPEGWSFAEAASVPVVFLTAYFGLRDLGGLRAGERVLVHAAAGGVGMAAVQLARAWGAEVFATASPGKWGVLRDQGFDDAHIASSRDASFGQHFGAGVDVVLDCLAGELVDAGLGLLGDGGRFLEMGKSDLRDPEQVATQFPGVRYRAFDLAEAGPARMGEILAELMGLFQAGRLELLPRAVWDVRQARSAFRFMSQARHVGKIVLSVPQPLDLEGVAVITGGLGSLGMLTARHLVARHGIRHLVLAGRRGMDTPGAEADVLTLQQLGARVEVRACDVADRDGVRTLLSDMPEGRRVTAVVHSAGVLDDGVISELTPERFAAVFGPKVDAVAHLDALTRELYPDLDAFVVFSSASGTFGSAGQGNYAAANAYLDAAMIRRRAAGLPGLSLAWGLWRQDAGMTGHLTAADHARMSRGGFLPLTGEEGLALLDAALGSGEPVVVPAKLDLHALRDGDSGAVPPIFRALVRPVRRAVRASASTAGGGLAARLAPLAPAEREQVLLDLVRTAAASVLGHVDGAQAAADRAFKDVGFDSLTSVELRNRLRESTGVRLSATAVFDYPTPLALARHLRDELVGVQASAAPVAPTATATAAALAAAATAATDDPIVIVGMSCRMPGAVTDPAEFWDLLRAGRDGTGPFPTDRGWDLDGLFDDDPEHAGTSYVRNGGFLDDASGFDADFFGISPREATAMDPQQRLLLEGSWEALESAGIDPVSLRGSDVGVFSGVSSHGYSVQAGGGIPEGVEGYLATGTSVSVASGRVSYVFGFEGPAVTVDTACSSGLVAIHLAGQALRSGECSMALAGAVAAMATPGAFVEFSRQRGLAADGHCKPFSASADGTGWSEGVGIVVLERLSDAQRLGHRILAVVKGSAVNSDGASNGLTAPNGPSQQRVIRRALAAAGVDAAGVDAVEAHGTGTTLGDPIEAQALIATYGRDRDPERPLWLGSVKSNIGHTQAAAGIAGVIKMVQALRHEELPPTLHVTEPTTEVDWSADTVRLLTERRPWVRNGRPRRAGVSAFGISGTNAHLILEEAPEADKPMSATLVESVPDGAAAVVPVVISARGRGALGRQAARLCEYLTSDSDLVAVADALVAERAVLPDRAVVVAADVAEAVAGLDVLPSPAARLTNSDVVFVFPGQGAQWVGMGRVLRDRFPVFAERFDEACALLDDVAPDDLRAAIFDGSGSVPGAVDGVALVDQTVVAQAGLFAVQVGLVALLDSFGVRPAAVVGHSIGEVAAAYAAGVLSLADAARLVAARGLAMQQAPAGGAMAAINAPEDEIRPLLTEGVEISGVNAADSVVLSGRREAIEPIVDALREQGRRVRWLSVSHAFHSADMDPVLPRFADALNEITFATPQLPWFSTASGRQVEAIDVAYWVDQARGAVRFADGIGAALANGHHTFLEIGPATLSGLIDHDDTIALALTRRDHPEDRDLLTALADLFTRGLDINWQAAFPPLPPGPAATVELPTYAFQHQRYWLEATIRGDASSLGLTETGHPLLGTLVELPETGGAAFTSRLSLATHPWLADHAVDGTAAIPLAALTDLAIRAGDHTGTSVLADFDLIAAPTLRERGTLRLRTTVGAADDDGRRPLGVYSAPGDGDGPFERHATGHLRPATATTAVPPTDANANANANADADSDGNGNASWPPAGAIALDTAALAQEWAAAGSVEHGPAYTTLRAAWRLGEEYLAELTLNDDRERPGADSFGIHPGLLDAAWQLLIPADERDGDATTPRLPATVRGVTLHAEGAASVRIRLTPAGPDSWSMTATGTDGAAILTADAIVVHPVEIKRPAATHAAVGNAAALYRHTWQTLPDAAVAAEALPVPAGAAQGWAVIRDAASVTALAAEIRDSGQSPRWALLPADRTLAEVLAAVQAWLAEPATATARLLVTTCGVDVDPAAAAVWGLVRAAQAENPDRLALLDLAPRTGADGSAATSPDLSTLSVGLAEAVETAAAAGETQLALRDGALLVPRLLPAAAEPLDAAAPAESAEPADAAHPAEPVDAADAAGPAKPTEPAHPLDPEGVVLITGGTGSLGGLVAEHLVTTHGVRHLILAGRRGPDAPNAAELTTRLTALGATVHIVACDVGDPDAARRLLTSLPDSRRLTGLVHAAGVLNGGVFGALDETLLSEAAVPKSDAAALLDDLTRQLHPDLDVFVLFSSVTGLFLGSGTGAYAAANAALDAVAARRRAAGFPALTLTWGPWNRADGIAAGLGELDRARIARVGIALLDTADGLALFDAALRLRGTDSRLVAVRLNPPALAAGGPVPPLLRALVRPARRRAGAAADRPADDGFAQRLAAMPPAEQERTVLDLVRRNAAEVLGYGAQHAAIPADRAFKDAGFDSLAGVELRNRLRRGTGLQLPASAVFDYPTPLAMARYVVTALNPEDDVYQQLHAHLAGLEELAAGAADSDVRMAGVLARLHEVTARLAGGSDTDLASDTASDAVEQLESASADDVFDFIDREFGDLGESGRL